MSKITIETSVLRAASAFQSTEQVRYYLNGVFFSKCRLIATDGTRLAVIKPDMFLVEGDAPADFILPSDTIRKILAVKFGKNDIPHVVFDTEAMQAAVYDAMPQGGKHKPECRFDYAVVDGQFPDWRRIIPAADQYAQPASCVGLNPDLLGTFKAFGENTTWFLNNDAAAPAIVRARAGNFEAFGLCMPMRSAVKVDAILPDWLDAKEGAA